MPYISYSVGEPHVIVWQVDFTALTFVSSFDVHWP
jgi:hypothetical protein